MKLPSLNVDASGHSYFTDVESTDPTKGNQPREQEIAYWQFWETQPGHFQNFKPSEDPCCLAVLSGKLEITSSLGERRYFSRGDLFLLQDVSGKGHAVRTYGLESCTVLRIGMKQVMPASAS